VNRRTRTAYGAGSAGRRGRRSTSPSTLDNVCYVNRWTRARRCAASRAAERCAHARAPNGSREQLHDLRRLGCGTTIEEVMIWVLIALALIKVPIAALMLWLPFRSDEALRLPETPQPESSQENDDDGGQLRDTRPRSPRPRRGAHGPPPAAPARVRTPAFGRTHRNPMRVSSTRCRARSGTSTSPALHA
jgi:hypothetical protein